MYHIVQECVPSDEDGTRTKKKHKGSVDTMKRIGSVIVVFLFCGMLGMVIPIGNVAGLDGKETDLKDIDVKFEGIGSDDRFGMDVAMFGDINDDGLGDYGIMAARANQSSSVTATGALYIFFGNTTGYSGNLKAEDADVTIWGNESLQSTDAFDAIEYIGDIDDDGLNDVVIGATDYNTDGQAFIFFGRASWNNNYTTGDADSTWNETNTASFGNSGGSDVAGAGDVNGDGIDDLLIGSMWAGNNSDGMCYLLLGRQRSLWPQYAELPVSANHSFLAEGDWVDLGYVAGGGDINNDGYDDFMLGARFEPSGTGGVFNGKAYLMFGNATLNWGINYSLTNQTPYFWGENTSSRVGQSFDIVGDVNGDGFDDMALSGYMDETNGTDAGRGYLVLGHGGSWKTNNSLENASVLFYAGDAGDNFGLGISRIGDVNGDGLDDVIFGAPLNDTSDDAAGQTYIFLGRSSWKANYTADEADISYTGEGPDDQSGTAVGGGEDVNGDGLDDILIGAPMNDTFNKAPDNGKAYLIHPEDNIEPTTITSVIPYTDATYSTVATDTKMGNMVFVQVVGTDGDPGRANFATVFVISNGTDPIGIPVMCKETGANTGIYRGNFTVRSTSSVSSREIGASVSELVNASAKKDPAKKFSLQVRGVQLYPSTDTDIAIDGASYKTPYWAVTTEGAPVWSFSTNASWLAWGAGNHTVYGTPAIANIGKLYWVNVSTTAGSYSDKHNFTITVWGATPTLTVAHVATATEDVYYSTDYNTNHDALAMNFSMDITSPWLTLNQTTGMLNGTPTNAHVNKVYINMTVNYPWCIAPLVSPFNVTVANVAPTITTTDVTSVLQDQNYNVDYNSTDDGQGTIAWTIKTNASWMSHVNSIITGSRSTTMSGITT